MAELATIARPYAEALYRVLGSDAAAASSWLDELATLSAQPQLRQFADNPRVTAQQVFDLVSGLTHAPLPDAGRNFLRAVIDQGRLGALPTVASQFHALANAGSGVSDALVYSAFPIDAAALDSLGAALERRFGRKLRLSVEQDASLIGGIRVVVGDEVLDTSVRARLAQMKAALSA